MYIIRWNYSFLDDVISEDKELLKKVITSVYPNAVETDEDEDTVFVETLESGRIVERAWLNDEYVVTQNNFSDVIEMLKEKRA